MFHVATLVAFMGVGCCNAKALESVACRGMGCGTGCYFRCHCAVRDLGTHRSRISCRQFGELLGSAGGGAVIFGLAAVVRNLAVPKQLQEPLIWGACLEV